RTGEPTLARAWSGLDPTLVPERKRRRSRGERTGVPDSADCRARTALAQPVAPRLPRRDPARDNPGPRRRHGRAQTAQRRQIDVTENEAQRVFALQRAAHLRHPYPSIEERLENLRKVERILLDDADAIADAINADFGHRAAEESKMLELFTSVDGIRHVRRKLRKWMRPQSRSVSVLFASGSNRVVPQPKGVVGIVSPWNYPLFLTVSPLTSILAAGNRAMIKMASNSQHLCRLLQQRFAAHFPEDLVAV